MKDKPANSIPLSPRDSHHKFPQDAHKTSKYSPDVRSQKEKDLAKEIKATLKADGWNKLPDLLTEWEVISPKDILIDCGIQLLGKDRHLCEKIFDHVMKRGPLKGNEYSFSSAIVHLAICQLQLNKLDECVGNLVRALRFTEQQLRSKELDERERKPSSSTTGGGGTSGGGAGAASNLLAGSGGGGAVVVGYPATREEWSDLKDWISVFLAVMSFRRHNFEETLRLLDTTANYQLVLKPNKFAFLTLLKAKSFCELRQPEEAVRILQMRQSQEDALSQIGQINLSPARQDTKHSSRNSTGPSTSTKRPTSPDDTESSSSPSESANISDGPQSIYACHDLHLMILERMGREEEAKELFKDLKADGSKRVAAFKDFTKKVRMEDIGNSLVETWVPKPSELLRRF